MLIFFSSDLEFSFCYEYHFFLNSSYNFHVKKFTNCVTLQFFDILVYYTYKYDIILIKTKNKNYYRNKILFSFLFLTNLVEIISSIVLRRNVLKVIYNVSHVEYTCLHTYVSNVIINSKSIDSRK